MKTILRSDGLSCPSCVAKIEKALRGLAGVKDAEVHFTTGRIEVDHDPEVVPPETLAGRVEETGYPARVATY